MKPTAFGLPLAFAVILAGSPASYGTENADQERERAVAKTELLQSIKEINEFLIQDLNKLKSILLRNSKPKVGIGVKLFFNPEDQTLEVTKVYKGKPADKAGLTIDDRILSVNEHSFSTVEGYVGELEGDGSTGRTITLKVIRGDNRRTVLIKTEVLWDKTTEVIQLGEQIRLEADRLLDRLYIAADKLIPAIKSGKIDPLNPDDNALFQEHNQAVGDLYSWLIDKDEQAGKLLDPKD